MPMLLHLSVDVKHTVSPHSEAVCSARDLTLQVETGSFVKLAYTWLNTFDVHLALEGVSNPIGHDIAH